MDSIFGIGIPELIIILLLAGLIMGPQRIRQVAYTMGRITAQLQRVSREFTRQLNAELDSLEDGSIRDTMKDVRQLQKEVEELRRELANAPKALQDAGQKVKQETEQALQNEVADQTVDEKVESAPSDSSPPDSSPTSAAPQLPRPIDVPGDSD